MKIPLWARRFANHQQASTLICGLVQLVIANIWVGYASGTETLFVWFASGHEVAFYLSLSPAICMLLISTVLKPYPRSHVYHPPLRKQKDQEQNAMYGRDDDAPHR